MVLPQSLLLCQAFQIMFAGTPYSFSLLPRGQCHLCCETILEDDIIFTTHDLRSGESMRAGVSAGAPWLDPRKATVVYVHGFTEQATSTSATTLRRAYSVSGRDVNFVTMDWARLSTFPWYANAVDNAPVAGRYLARFLERVFQDGVNPSLTHVIGFSLGAEVAGFAGQSLQQERRHSLGRITGLDPAFPLFRWTSQEGHLSADDADFVDVIHTDGGLLGVMHAIGDADFYPNGGRQTQPGCRTSELQRLGQYPQQFIACSHSRAWVYFAESILQPNAFAALRCGSETDFRSGRCAEDAIRFQFRFRSEANNMTEPDPVSYMGLMASKGCRGSYFLDTNDRFPFGRGIDFPVTLAEPAVVFT